MTTIENIEQILSWYYRNSSTSSIDELINNRDKLAVWSCNLAQETSDAFIGYNHAYFVRKVNTSRKINSLIKQEMAVNKAENQAIEELADIWETEKEKEAYAHKCDLFLKQVNKVLEAFNQRISYEKEEKFNSKNQQT
ncbi:MAG: hypothetical protein O2887_10455 [Bacteroidetes bacterium]|nr:hypothetical protein [Bacteroidota bacterium]